MAMIPRTRKQAIMFSLGLAAVFIALLLAFVPEAKADSWAFRMGPSMDDGVDGTAKIFSARTERHVYKGLFESSEIGAWFDNKPGRSNSVFMKSQIGVAPGPAEGFFAKAFLGAALISGTDSQLGGHLQFSEDIGIGVRDEATTVGLTYSHFSSAGISKPNKGRDWLIFEVGVSW